MKNYWQATVIVPGEVEASLLLTHEPLSFWGGYDFETGTIIDQRHPLVGQVAAGRILALALYHADRVLRQPCCWRPFVRAPRLWP